MFSTDDTIVAIATPPGRGGIGVVRLSGPRAELIAPAFLALSAPLVPRHATLTTIRLSAPTSRSAELGSIESRAVGDDGPADVASGMSRALDHAVVTLFRAPHSYTGEDVVEVSAHGSPVVLHSIVAAAVAAGARAARRGEFTLRAFLNQRIDLPQAEAVADLIDAVTPLQAQAAFDQLQGTLTRAIDAIDRPLFDLIAKLEASIDFPDEGFHFVEPGAIVGSLRQLEADVSRLLERGRQGRLVREGRVVAIVGAPNVGKSSLFNALVGSSRAIVTDIPGTTRDLISEIVDLDGLRVTLVDTAGVRDSIDPIETAGVALSLEAARTADVVLEVVDGTAGIAATRATVAGASAIRVRNKSDRPDFRAVSEEIAVSATQPAGLSELKQEIIRRLGVVDSVECPEISNIRHLSLLEMALESLHSARQALESSPNLSEEFLLADLQRSRACLEEVTGKRTTDDLLAHIFERFCVGK